MNLHRAAVAFLVLAPIASVGACAARPHPAPRPAVATPAPAPRLHSDGVVEKRADGSTRYVDRPRGFELVVPAGWTALTDFATDDEGPPAAGDLRVRLRAPRPGCAIDVATLSPLSAGEVARALSAGRDVFFLARSDSPVPGAFPNDGVWAATTSPAIPGKTDTGYWVMASAAWIRIEGRFASDRFPECKASLDDVVSSLASASAGAPGTGTPQASRNRG
ncbi:MAG TPA: hypothetical protein VMV18_06975 [bacterium]|nr:hypothetical protein [bacterium]